MYPIYGMISHEYSFTGKLHASKRQVTQFEQLVDM